MAVTLPIAEASAPACVDPDVTRAGLVSMLLNLVPMQVNRIVLAANDGGQVFVAIAAYGRDVTSTITIAIFLPAFLALVDLPKHLVRRLLRYCFVCTSSQCMLNHVHLLRKSGGKF